MPRLSMIESMQHTHRLYNVFNILFPASHQTGKCNQKELAVCRARVSLFIWLSGILYDFETNNTVIRHSPIINFTLYVR
jgi:hypothetical protein